MGFDTKRFNESDLKPDLLCIICNDVFDDPVQREPCEHFFCRKCITEWLNTSPICPIDRQPLTPNDLKEALRLLKSLLSDLSINCDFIDDGCQAAVTLDGIESHVKACKFSPDAVIGCDKKCGSSFKQKDRESHCCLSFLKGENQRLEATQKDMMTDFEAERQLMREENNALREKVNQLMGEKEKRQQLLKTLQINVKKLKEEAGIMFEPDQDQSLPPVRLLTSSEHLNKCLAESMYRKMRGNIDKEMTVRKGRIEGRLKKWAPYLKMGSNVLFYENSDLFAISEWVFLALMVGPRGHVMIINPSERQVLEVKTEYDSLITSGRVKFSAIESTGEQFNGTFDFIRETDGNRSESFYALLKVGGVLFSQDDVYEKLDDGMFAPFLSVY